MPLRPLFVFGTRPEAIKLAPVIQECQRLEGLLEPLVWVTGQHRELLDLAMTDFQLRSDLDFQLMRAGQTPLGLLGRCLERLEHELPRANPDCIIVQGDTTSALAGGIAGFHQKIPVVHVEAGLRTGNLARPFPEEFNRRALTLTATMHCAPTPMAAEALRRDGVICDDIRVTGNTVIDALRWMLAQPRPSRPVLAGHPVHDGEPLVLVTVHRRENFGEGVCQIIQAVATLIERFPEITFVWPVHRNPEVEHVVRRMMPSRGNLRMTGPLSYSTFAPLLAQTSVILTDSGGIQEEACYLQIPTVILRNETERPEAVESQYAQVVGTDGGVIVETMTRLLRSASGQNLTSTGNQSCPFGDGHAARQIVEWMRERLG